MELLACHHTVEVLDEVALGVVGSCDKECGIAKLSQRECVAHHGNRCRVDNDDITLKARKYANAIGEAADDYSRELKMRTYDYLDKMLFDMQAKMTSLNDKYLKEIYDTMEKTFVGIDEELQVNRDELKEMAIRTRNGEEWLEAYEGQSAEAEPEEN